MILSNNGALSVFSSWKKKSLLETIHCLYNYPGGGGEGGGRRDKYNLMFEYLEFSISKDFKSDNWERIKYKRTILLR